jgi:hypothetical protein
MFVPLEKEFESIVETVAPSLIDLDELNRLVALDEEHDPSEGECTIHDGCRPITRY